MRIPKRQSHPSNSIIGARNRRPKHRPRRHHARPNFGPQLFILQIRPIITRRPSSDLRRRIHHTHLQDLRARHFGFGGRQARVGPAVFDHVVGDVLHRPEFLVHVGNRYCVAVQDGGAVVVAMVVWREGEHEAVDVGSCHG